MADALLALKSDPKVLDALRQAAQHPPSQAEMHEQRVSFVYSAMSEKGGATRDRVRELVDAHELGRTAVHS